jgi:hypothetical protein
MALIAPLALPLSAQTSGFPTRPLSAVTTAVGDAGTSPFGLDAVFMNPARAAAASGFLATYVTHEQTGLRGYAVSAGFVALVPLTVSVWKYDVGSLFDDELLAADPSLASLGVFTTGMDLAAATSAGSFRVGVGTSVEFQHNLTMESQRFAARLGVLWDEPFGMVALSWAGEPGASPVSGLSSGIARGTVVVRPLRGPVSAEAGLEATWSPSDAGVEISTSALIGPAPLRIIAGWRWSAMQPAAGMILRVDKFAIAVAREFSGEDALGGLTVLTFSMAW